MYICIYIYILYYYLRHINQSSGKKWQFLIPILECILHDTPAFCCNGTMLGQSGQVQEPPAKRARTEPGPTMDEDAEALRKLLWGPMAIFRSGSWLKRLKSPQFMLYNSSSKRLDCSRTIWDFRQTWVDFEQLKLEEQVSPCSASAVLMLGFVHIQL